MKDERFDELARNFAEGLSRRQFLKILLGGLASSTLYFLGYKLKQDEYAVSGAQGSTAQQVYLPIVIKSCPEASSCGDRHYCNEEQTCLCVRSAEGDIRCGKIPDTCYAQLCQTSADCANLGEGYFCDTPNSGCCYDPPAELPRCIAPCPPPCPVERKCGSICCEEGELCIGGVCKVCTPEQVCGDKCCGEGEECLNGICINTCLNDPITAESLKAARAALAVGENYVYLSPGGCQAYRRVVDADAGVLTYEEVLVAGQRVVRVDHYGDHSLLRIDGDFDGYFEEYTTIYYPTSVFGEEVYYVENSPITRKTVRQETYTRTDETTIHVVWEVDDGSGTLVKEAEFDTTLDQPTWSEGGDMGSSSSSTGAQVSSCTAAEISAIKQKLDECVLEGFKCLRDKDRSDLGYKMLHRNVSRTTNITCASLPGDIARMSVWSSFMDFSKIVSDINISIDPDKWFDANRNPKLTPEQQCNVLWHEMLHLHFYAHNPDLVGTPRQREIDPTFACASLCFEVNPNIWTKCACARCLKTTACDPRCQPYNCCDPDMGGMCTCPCRYKYYDKLSDCEAECPSGLCCFTFRCIPYDVSGDCNVKCP